MKKLKIRPLLWFRIVRPQTLFASVCPVLVGLMVAGHVEWLTGALTLVCAVALQILSNLINDYYDFRRGADQAGRAGFRRALAEGEVTEQQMLRAVWTALCVSVVTGAWLVWTGGWPILCIGLTAILFAWLYTATPYSLSYLGVADVFVFLYYGVVASVGTTWLQTGVWSAQSFCAGAVCGLLSMCVLATNNLRDMQTDAAVGKRTFAVR
ncbi:MAG: 1,4-dihydroxy-2-naphthoate octaprenyltransferase, partial [Paludibacteraceae bacterium]|nr:1,4-dihydroxy-2-naphthoate octaprenyltransferase [Paludibacteraceae bacterium]